MHAQQNNRYRQAAADYLSLPRDHPRVIRLAWQACQAADMAAFEVLRSGAGQAEGRDEMHALSHRVSHI